MEKCKYCNQDLLKISHHCSGKLAYLKGFTDAKQNNDVIFNFLIYGKPKKEEKPLIIKQEIKEEEF